MRGDDDRERLGAVQQRAERVQPPARLEVLRRPLRRPALRRPSGWWPGLRRSSGCGPARRSGPAGWGPRGRRRGVLRLAHRPSARSSPSAVSRSRSRAASAGARPGTLRVAGRGGGVQLHRGQVERPLQRPGGDVDELHPGVRDDRQPADQQPVADQQVVVALGVPPGLDGADDDERRAPRRAPRRRPRPGRTTPDAGEQPADQRSAGQRSRRSRSHRRISSTPISRRETGRQLDGVRPRLQRARPGRRRAGCGHGGEAYASSASSCVRARLAPRAGSRARRGSRPATRGARRRRARSCAARASCSFGLFHRSAQDAPARGSPSRSRCGSSDA